MTRSTIIILTMALLLSPVVMASDQLLWADAGDVVLFDKCYQAGRPDHDFGGPGKSGEPRGRQMRKHINQLRMLKLLELLDLGEDQEVEFLVAYRSAKKSIKALEDSLWQQVTLLSEALKKADPNDDEILGLLTTIDRLEASRMSSMRLLRDDIRPFLTPLQQGKLVVFQHRFEEELLRQVRAFREQRGHGRQPTSSDDSLIEHNK